MEERIGDAGEIVIGLLVVGDWWLVIGVMSVPKIG